MRVGVLVGVVSCVVAAGCSTTVSGTASDGGVSRDAGGVAEFRPVLSAVAPVAGSAVPTSPGAVAPPACAEYRDRPSMEAGKACRQDPLLGISDEYRAGVVSAFGCADRALDGKTDSDLPLATCDEDGAESFVLDRAILGGDDIATATASPDPNGTGWTVQLSFRSAAQAVWSEYTREHVQERVTFTVDGRVVSAPTIQSAITGETTVTGGQGGFTEEEATTLADRLGG